MSDTPLVGAQTIHPNNNKKETPQIVYSEEAKHYINFRRQRMVAARDARDIARQEWDDMTFLQWYEVMKKADDQYVAPRKNAQDTSINMGTIRDKDTHLVEYAAKYDFEPVAQAYDDSNDLLVEIAESAEDMVTKSKLMEEYKMKAKLIYRSMVAFGTALVEDQWIERWTIEKEFGASAKIGSSQTSWTERKVKQYDGCQAKLWDLRKCYFGDIRKFFMNGPQGQPYFFTVEYEAYDVVKQLFGEWDRFQYVPTSVVLTPEVAGTANSWQYGWTIRPVSLNYVEIIRYYDPVANEFAITLNGVDMLPIQERKVTGTDGKEKTLISAFPLTAISPSGAIPFAKFDLEPMHDFAYSKSQPAKMRVAADVENMMVKLFIGMFKQKVKPTMGNQSGRSFGSEITDPATVINDIREHDLFPVLPNFQGAQPADFSFYELMKKELDKNSVERSSQGMDSPSPQDETATGDMNNLKAQSLKLASLFDGIIYGENQLAWLRTYNIAKNWTKPIDQDIDTLKKEVKNKYRSISMPSEMSGGQKALKKISFTKDTTRGISDKQEADELKASGRSLRSESIHQEEIDAQEKGNGTPVRLTYIHPEQFRDLKMDWFYTHVPVPNGSDPLAYMMFSKQIADATAFFGPQSLNVKKLKHKFASKTGEDFDVWFLGDSELAQATSQMAPTLPAPTSKGGQNNGAPPPGAPNVGGAGAASNNLAPKQPMFSAM